MEKPIYKKWWFIALMVFLVLSVIGALTDDGEKDVAEKDDTKKEVEVVSQETLEQKAEREAKESEEEA